MRFEDEYAAFYRAEFPHVVRTSYLIVHDRHRAEEIAQEAFIQLLHPLGEGLEVRAAGGVGTAPRDPDRLGIRPP